MMERFITYKQLQEEHTETWSTVHNVFTTYQQIEDMKLFTSNKFIIVTKKKQDKN